MRLQHALFTGALTPLLAEARSLNFDFPYNASTPVPFTISVDKQFIEETQLKAKLYRPPHETMVTLAKDWANSYDWFEVQDEINSNFSHYAVTVDGPEDWNHPVPLHFVHERSDDPDAIPLLLLHGWPSSHLEWSKVIKPLSSGNGSSNVTFHVVAPDLPGYGFSPAPEYAGLSPSRMGIAFDKLMKTLGYEKYGVASTDVGWMVGMWMTHDVSESLIGHFTDFFLMQPNSTDLERYAQNQTTAEESAFISSITTWFGTRSSYATVHSQAPLAIGQAMSDTPVGFAGWILQLMHPISGAYAYSSTEVITDALMLWIQGVWGGLRSYKECFDVTQGPGLSRNYGPNCTHAVGGPTVTGIENFNFLPRDWAERWVNVVYMSRHDAGGHFPAVSEPDAWVQEVRHVFGGLITGAF
uniref:Epoxide hydrolase N-terminal domain-containing protein n=1 Tax=Bionectria ochroleuca TaxID=29856 RepID=A0A8H7TQA6_BIOOC